MTTELNTGLVEQLEAIVDRHGLARVLDGLISVCQKKARTCHADRDANTWDIASYAILVTRDAAAVQAAQQIWGE